MPSKSLDIFGPDEFVFHWNSFFTLCLSVCSPDSGLPIRQFEFVIHVEFLVNVQCQCQFVNNMSRNESNQELSRCRVASSRLQSSSLTSTGSDFLARSTHARCQLPEVSYFTTQPAFRWRSNDKNTVSVGSDISTDLRWHNFFAGTQLLM